jgi:hypothetical protein
MNETTRVLDESHATAASPEKESKAAEFGVRVAADAPAHTSRALPSRPARPNFMDLFAPRHRQPTDPSVPRYTALAEPPTVLSGAESPITPEILGPSSDQSSEETGLHGKG